MNLSEKIFKQKLEIFLKPILDILTTKNISLAKNNSNKKSIQEFVLKKPSENLILYLYFNKFSFLLKDKNLKSSFIKEEMKEIEKEIETVIIKSFKQEKYLNEFYVHFKKYGQFNKRLIELIYKDIFINLIGEEQSQKNFNDFLKISKILMFSEFRTTNENKEKNTCDISNNLEKLNWKQICKEKLEKNLNYYIKTKNNSDIKLYEYVLDEHTLKDFNENSKKSKYISSSHNNLDLSNKGYSTSFRQINLQNSLLRNLKDVKSEYTRAGYIYDCYSESKDIIFEFNGPQHFYPLQTQLIDSDKFRIKNIYQNFKSKIVIIPYYEWERLETDKHIDIYLEKAINLKYNLLDSPLFKENFDLTKFARKYI